MSAGLLVVCLDGGDPRVIDELLEAGRLPAVKRLVDKGCRVRIPTQGELLEESVWPSLLSGAPQTAIGQIHFHEFEPSTMGLRRADEPEVEPLWLHLPDRGEGAFVMDASLIAVHPDSRADHVCAWSSFSPRHPASFSSPELERTFPKQPAVLTEPKRAPSLQDERDLAAELIRRSARRAALIEERARGRSVSIVGVHETHAAVHLLGHHWDKDHWHRTDQADPELVTGLYEALDKQLAPVLDWGGDVMVIACNGIRPSNPADQLLEEMLIRAGMLAKWGSAPSADGAEASASRPSIEQRIRALLPERLRELLATRFLPEGVQHTLASRRFRDQYDWSQTSVFPVPTWSAGYLRLNVRGREAQGIVEEADVPELLDTVERLLNESTDAATGLPLVSETLRARGLPGEDQLPDLMIKWAANGPVRRAHHPELGDWDAEPEIHMHRYSLHRDGGVVIMAGPSVRSVEEDVEGHGLDVAPTVLALRSVSKPSSMSGRVWRDLLIDA